VRAFDPGRVVGLLSLSAFLMAFLVGTLLWVVEFGLIIDLPLVVFVLVYAIWITSNYFFEIVEYKALGNMAWPVFSLETLVGKRSQVGVVFSILVLGMAAFYAFMSYFAMDRLAQLLLGVALILLPASVALLAVTRSFAVALNPVKVLAATLGFGYRYIHCALAAVGLLFMLGFAREHGGLLWYFPLIYGLFLLAYLIGTVVYTRRAVLGVEAPRSPEAVAARQNARIIEIRKGVLAHAYGFATRGNVAGALRHIAEYLGNEEDTLAARLWIFNEMTRWEDSYPALAMGKETIDYCEKQGLADEAARVRLICEHLRKGEGRSGGSE
jgi:hypothetical protein